ncbi:MAG: AsmA-like C-terminal domain-containing protein [Desulfuromonadales bacterium]
MTRRRLVIYSLLALAVILAAAIVFIATFDANRYLSYIEGALSEKIDHPVRIGHIETTLLPEPVVVISDLQVGGAQDEFTFRADRLTLKPKSKRLVVGKLHFREIIAESPRLLATVETECREEKPPEGDESQPPDFTIDSLRINNASWRVTVKREPDFQRSYSGSRFSVDASGIAPARVEEFTAKGVLTQGEDSAEASLGGHLLPEGEGRNHADIALHLDTAPLGDEFLALLPLPGRTLHGPAALTFDLHTTASAALEVTMRLEGEQISLQKTTTGQSLWSSDAISVAASLYFDEDRLQLRNVVAKAGDISLNGSLLARQSVQGVLFKAAVEDAALPLSLARAGKFTDRRMLHLDDGELELLLDEACLPGLEDGAPAENMPPPDVLKLAGTGRIERQNGENIRAEDIPLRFSSTVSSISSDEPNIDATIDTTLNEENLFDVIEKFETDRLQIGGESSAHLHLTGSPETIRFDLEADLTGLVLKSEQLLSKEQGDAGHLKLQGRRQGESWNITTGTLDLAKIRANLKTEDLQIGGETGLLMHLRGEPANIHFTAESDLAGLTVDSGQFFSKEKGEAGKLKFQGQRRTEGWDIDDASLNLPPFDVHAEGRLSTEDSDFSYDLSLTLAKFDIAEAYSLAPILDQIGLYGEVEGRARLTPAGRAGTFELHHVGLPVPGKLAEISQLSGAVNLKDRRLEAPDLKALLGESVLDLSVAVEDLSSPRFEIHMECPSLRANDLIFPNRQAFLRDVEADFVISRDGLHLVDGRTRLDGGTVAHVEGTISPFSSPDVMLAVDAEYGNIDEVIALFRRPQGAQDSRVKRKKGAIGEVLVDISASEGRFHSLEFTDAEGFLAIREGRMTIHPLSFHSTNGYFTGMVLRDSSAEPPSRLKISGHLEGFDAATLYSQQLKHKGMITGNLRGDFYLEGIEGKERFLKSSQGSFNILIDGGVLLRFKILSKIFSILNVSQIFNFTLPDTSSRGMPYDKLAATVRLRQGILETDNLFIDSEAMNMTAVGSMNLLDKSLDLIIGVKPLQTVDEIITKIPIAGWLLTGEEKTLITTHFEVAGTTDDPKVRPIPISSVSDKAKGIFRRLFGLPEKLIKDVEDIFD